MHGKAGWTVGVATMLLILGTPQVSRPEATISFSSRYYYFCWNPGTQGHACSPRSSNKIWMVSDVPVEVELRADCQQQHYAQVLYASEESKVIETFDEECEQGAKHQRLRRDAQQERARHDVPKQSIETAQGAASVCAHCSSLTSQVRLAGAQEGSHASDDVRR